MGKYSSLRTPLLIVSFVLVGLFVIGLAYSKRQRSPALPGRNLPEGRGSSETNDRLADRELVRLLAEQLVPTGTLYISGAPSLVIGSKRFEVGTRFVVTYLGVEYDLMLVALDRATFTLRYRNEEITRPIRSAKRVY